MKWKYYSSKPYNDLETKDFYVLEDGTCECSAFDDNGDIVLDAHGEPVKAAKCDGTCGELRMELFEEHAKQWFEPTTHRYFVYGLPRWDGRHDGEIITNDPKDFMYTFSKGFYSIKWLFHRTPKKPGAKKYNKTVLRFIVAGHDVPVPKWVTVEKDTKPWVEYY